jgi:hypothetical protein
MFHRARFCNGRWDFIYLLIFRLETRAMAHHLSLSHVGSQTDTCSYLLLSLLSKKFNPQAKNF